MLAGGGETGDRPYRHDHEATRQRSRYQIKPTKTRASWIRDDYDDDDDDVLFYVMFRPMC